MGRCPRGARFPQVEPSTRLDRALFGAGQTAGGAGSVVGSALAVTTSHGLARYVGALPVVTPAMLVACGGTMLLLSVAAVVAPSLRACRVDPLSVLRGE